METKKYKLVDSGEGEKLESFGNILVRRPSSLAIWAKNKPYLWDKADASFDPKKALWIFKSHTSGLTKDLAWNCIFTDNTLKLRFQDNGQVGVFPEHASYLDSLYDKAGEPIKVLNLFAFTGLATLFFREKGAQVTHVDLSKKVISWAKENVDLQKEGLPDVRWVLDDAVAYIRREVRRESNYDGVIIDPPSFSRISKNDFWKIEEVLPELMQLCSKLLNKHGKFLAFTCHDPGISAKMLTNLIHDNFDSGQVEARELEIPEYDSKRVLPAGSCGIWRR
jgi:23S rRNA (cytosine1962-C5)-methyltransferase